MTESSEARLHIGGPLDGELRIYPARWGRVVVVPRPKEPTYVGHRGDPPQGSITIAHDHYLETGMIGPAGRAGPLFRFWLHESLEPDEGCAKAWEWLVSKAVSEPAEIRVST